MCFLYSSSFPTLSTSYLFMPVRHLYIKLLTPNLGITLTWLIVHASLGLITMLFFLMCSFRDPGYLVNDTVDFLKLLEIFDPTLLCPDCKVIRTTRSRHCSICHRCVERFDHHCPWINNCVAIRNHNYFLLYIVTQYALLILSIVVTCFCIVKETLYDGSN